MGVIGRSGANYGAVHMPVKDASRLISLSAGARQTNLTPPGLLKILRRTGNAIRDDGRWYVDSAVIDQIASARRMLGLDRSYRHSITA
jgi:hypothetical protein